MRGLTGSLSDMSYIVTARKWRPQYFRDVVSQRHVTETLQNAIRSGRVGHAYLFSGPRGVGKTTVARIFAKALNCEHGPAEEPCNECSICRSIQSGASMDIQELDGASNNSVDDVRNLIATVGYHASQCRYKMYIVDEVHMLSTAAFNALLKTLEEPPPGVIFVFATTEPQKIPVTILSRCQRFDFHRLSVQEIAGKLKLIAQADGIEIDDASTLLIARRAGGAMRDGESILEQLKASRGGVVVAADVAEVLGMADREVFFGIIDRCHERDTRGALELFTAYFDGGGDLREFVEGLLGHLRDILYARFEGGLDHAPVSDEMREHLKQQSGWYETADLVRMITMITDIESSLAYAVVPVLRIELALVRMSMMESTVDLGRLFEKLGGDGRIEISFPSTPLPRTESKSVTSARSLPNPETSNRREIHTTPPFDAAPDAAETALSKSASVEAGNCTEIPADFHSIVSNWKEIAARVGVQKPAIGPSLAQGTPESYEKGKLSVYFEADHEFQKGICEQFRGDIEEIIGTILGTKVKLTCFVRRAGTERKRNNEVEDLIAREPIVRDILDRFDGEISDSWR